MNYNNGCHCIPIKLIVDHFPFIALDKDDNITLYMSYTGTNIITSVKMVNSYHMLDSMEKNKFATVGHEYLINHPIRTVLPIKSNVMDYAIPHYSDIITHLIITFHDRHNKLYTGDIEGSLRVDNKNRGCINKYQNICSYTNLDLTYKKGYWLIPFLLNYDTVQPSGRLNVKDANLSIKLDSMPEDIIDGHINITTFHYNVFRILEKIPVIAYNIENCTRIDYCKGIDSNNIEDNYESYIEDNNDSDMGDYDSDMEISI